MSTRPKVYLETTVLSYLTARPTRDLIIAAHQQITREWWERRESFDLFISELVLQEAGGGDVDAAARRLEAADGIPVLPLSREATDLARELVRTGPLPERALADALHISISALGGTDYLLTWNCTHIANATLRRGIERVCRLYGLEPPIICTPEELKED